MTTVFLAYQEKDALRVAKVARALEAAGLQVVWERARAGGADWHAKLEKELDDAGCVVAFWSQASVGEEGRELRDEARRGLERGVLVPVLLDRIERLPLGFGEVHAIDLTRWKGKVGDPFFHDLVAAIQAQLEGAEAPSATGPRARLNRRLLYGTVSGMGIAAISAVAMNAFGTAAMVCSAPGLQPGLSDACGAINLGDRPSRRERLAWGAMPRGDCEALKAHINRWPEGAYRGEAQALLAARHVSFVNRWTPTVRSLPLFASAAGAPASDASTARAAALKRATPDAQRLCAGFGATTLFRFVSATPHADAWTCAPAAKGVLCGFDGHAECAVEEHHMVEQDRCGPK